ncbi:MAG: hypothetical protein ABIB71_09370 [Candidatus Woesearchaeota archaeon]
MIKMVRLSWDDFYSEDIVKKDQFKEDIKTAYTLLHKVDLSMLLSKEREQLRKIRLANKINPLHLSRKSFTKNILKVKDKLETKVKDLERTIRNIQVGSPYCGDKEKIEKVSGLLYAGIKGSDFRSEARYEHEIGMISLSPETKIVFILNPVKECYSLQISPEVLCEGIGIQDWRERVLKKLYDQWQIKSFHVLDPKMNYLQE